MKRRLEADEEISGRNKKPKMSASTGSEPEGDVLVVSMVSARIQLTFTANSFPPCDLCHKNNRECTGRTRNTACDSCHISKRACTVGGVSIRVPRSMKQVANSVIAVREGSNATVAEGYRVVTVARDNLELAEQVQGLESPAVGLYKAGAIVDEETLRLALARYMKAEAAKAQQTDDHKSLD
jgi:hypothetical protein